MIKYDQISFAIKLCTNVEMTIEHFESDIYFHDILRKSAKHKKEVALKMKIIPNDCELWWLYFKNEQRDYLSWIQNVEFQVEEGFDDKKINSKEIMKSLGNISILKVVDLNEYSVHSFF